MVFTGCKKDSEARLAEQPMAKKIEFHVHASKQYNAGYDGVKADVKLAIYKINYRNGQSQLLWDTTYAARPLADYPHLPQKFLVEKDFDVLENKEKLQAVFNIRYHAPEGISQETYADELVPGDNFAFLDVDI